MAKGQGNVAKLTRKLKVQVMRDRLGNKSRWHEDSTADEFKVRQTVDADDYKRDVKGTIRAIKSIKGSPAPEFKRDEVPSYDLTMVRNCNRPKRPYRPRQEKERVKMGARWYGAV